MGDPMDYSVEEAPTDRSVCRRCKKHIPKGSKRLVFEGTFFGHPSKKFMDSKCGKEYLREQKAELDKIIKRLN